ncbi:hypothetical protein Bca4012_010165 [Brassica carinata]|uniref:Ubiquitin-like protease family profile domain-containing protein n=1 Tax=Brassica carinata TaxID=52824 RepID=A0A8X7S2W3_BRACI|nr:hypothetical protein Bca52824_035164 [Brassica carinata]
MQVKTLAHKRFSNTKLPAKPATPAKLEDSIGETTVQGIGGPQDPGKGGDKDEGKPVREVHPDNPEEENAVEDKDEELPFEGEGIDVKESAPKTLRESHPDNLEEENGVEDIEEELAFEGEGVDIDRLLQKIKNQSYFPEETEPSKKQDHRLLTPKVEATSESKKEPDYERHMDAALNFYRLRFQQHPGMFPSSRIAIMDVPFQQLWAHQYKNWQANNSVLPGGTYFYYYGLAPRYAETKMWWQENGDTLFSCLNVHKNTHWIAMVISIPDRTVKIYDSGKRSPRDRALRKEAEPFARMLSYALGFYAKDKEKELVDRIEFTIECIWKGVPRARPPYGDSGVYALKFLECPLMGVELNAKHLNDNNMA